MTRTRKFVRGLGTGFATQIIITVGGLWLVRFLLHALGPETYGLWLTASQVLLALGLLDLGVVALLPREVAWATGRGETHRVPDLLAGTIAIALRQSLAVAAVAAAVWWVLPADWATLRGPLGATLVAFVAFFPLRVVTHTLRGLQDLAFLGGLTAVAWFAQAAVLVVLVRAGWGLWALAVGWVAYQLVMVGVGLMRLRQLRPDAWRGRDPTRDDPAWRRERFRRGAWVSVSQVAHLLLAGVDLILIGALLGPAAVVTYSVTAKLATVLANQPQLLLQVAEPGLSELRTAGQPADVHRAAGALREVVLLGSAALACVVVGVNEAFVTWWVGGEPFGGTVLTILVVLRFLVGHWTLTLSTLLLAAGYERFLAMVGLGQGALAVLLMILLLPVVGIVAVPVAGTAAILLTGLPANLVALVRVTGVGIASQVAAMWPIAWRVALGLSLAVGVGQLGVRPTASWLALATLATALPFLVLSIGRLRQQPTTRYLHPRVREWLR